MQLIFEYELFLSTLIIIKFLCILAAVKKTSIAKMHTPFKFMKWFEIVLLLVVSESPVLFGIGLPCFRVYKVNFSWFWKEKYFPSLSLIYVCISVLSTCLSLLLKQLLSQPITLGPVLNSCERGKGGIDDLHSHKTQ